MALEKFLVADCLLKILYFLKLGSLRSDEFHRPPSSPVINLVGITDGSSPNLHRWRWLGRWISKSFGIHLPSSLPNHMSFPLCRKRCKIKYASSNFCLHLYHMEQYFSLRKKVCKEKVSGKVKEVKLKNILLQLICWEDGKKFHSPGWGKILYFCN